jgi:hypothetical protein
MTAVFGGTNSFNTDGAIFGQEFDGSPTYQGGPDNAGCRRIIYCTWVDLAFTLHLYVGHLSIGTGPQAHPAPSALVSCDPAQPFFAAAAETTPTARNRRNGERGGSFREIPPSNSLLYARNRIQCGLGLIHPQENSTMGPIERALRKSIADRKETRYATAKGASVTYPTLVRFLDGKADIRLSTVEAFCEYLGLELKAKK